MAVVLAYVDAVPGRLYPLVDTLLELAKRGHRVVVRCGIDDVERLRSIGLDAKSLTREIERFEPDDWRARTRFGALSSGLGQFGERARFQLRDLEQAIGDEQPDVLFVDEGAWGAAAAAERSGLPWAFSIVSPVPLPSRDAPPFGLGLRPRHDRLGRLRDRLVKPLTLGTLERMIAKHMNPLRAEIGLPPVATIEDVYLAASAVIAYTAEPFEYPRSDWPDKLTLVGPGLWEPPADPPAWLDSLDRPLVLVTCSTLFQNDRRLAEVAAAALAAEPFEVVITTADVDPTGLPAAPNVAGRALPPARTPTRPRGLRGLPRRYGDHAEGARPRCSGRRRSLRARPARGRPPGRGRTCRRQTPRPEADTGPPPRRRAPRNRATTGRRADRLGVRLRRRRPRGGRGDRRTPAPKSQGASADCRGGPAAGRDHGYRP